MDFDYGMDLEELNTRTSKEYYKGIKLLTSTSPAVKSLTKQDLKVLTYLAKAAAEFDTVCYKLDNHYNIDFLNWLEKQEKLGDPRASLAKKMFLSQKSIFSPDALGKQTSLAKGIKQPDGLGFFPDDLSADEFVKIIETMLNGGEENEVRKILNQRSVVVRDGKFLKAIDYVDYFPEFKAAAKQIRLAAKECEEGDFKDFLLKQAKALETADPELDAEADRAWAKLDETNKFEFTITRECYGEKLSQAVLSNKELMKRLSDLNIPVYTKDAVGARLGLVNKKGTNLLKKLKGLISVAAKYMPYSDEYDSPAENTNAEGQIAIDADIIALTGDEGAYRASIVLAQNLPNDDKLSVQTGGGRRNVYHRQIRANFNKKLYQNLINESQFKYFNPHASHLATICHENTHSLGPVSGSKLGAYSSILEEFKADMGMYAFLDEFKNAGYFSEEDCKEIMVTELASSFGKGKPTLSEAHRTRSVMIVNRMITEKAITFDKQGKLKFDFSKIKKTAKDMLAEVIRLQIDGDIKAAREYVQKWFVWSDEIDGVAEVIKKFSKKLNGYLISEFYEKLLQA